MADEKAESDIEQDDAVAGARETGGVGDPAKGDQASTTGTTPNEEYVGRIAGQDADDVGETGAEKRAQAGE